MREEERQVLRRLYRYRCGYCGTRERDAGAELTVDHFQPQSKGGLHAPENWVYCCHACNEFKGDYWQPDIPRRILHPFRDKMAEHMAQEADCRLKALTDTGEFHIERLRLNRDQLVEYRRERRRQQAVRRAQARRLERLEELEARVQALTEELNDIDRKDRDR
jgi:HNH endonuclease